MKILKLRVMIMIFINSDFIWMAFLFVIYLNNGQWTTDCYFKDYRLYILYVTVCDVIIALLFYVHLGRAKYLSFLLMWQSAFGFWLGHLRSFLIFYFSFWLQIQIVRWGYCIFLEGGVCLAVVLINSTLTWTLIGELCLVAARVLSSS